MHNRLESFLFLVAAFLGSAANCRRSVMANTNLSARNLFVANVANQVAEPRTVFGPAAIYPPTVPSLPRNLVLSRSGGSLGMGDAPTAMASVEVWAVCEGSAISAFSVRSVHALPHGLRKITSAAKRRQSTKRSASTLLVAI